jgi:hypothetical protein
MINRIFKGIFKNKGNIEVSNCDINIDAKPGDEVNIINKKIFINNKEVNNFEDCNEQEIKIIINGDITGKTIEIANFATINGDITGNVDTGNMSTINSKIINGDVDTGNMCDINSDKILGKINCGNMCSIETTY